MRDFEMAVEDWIAPSDRSEDEWSVGQLVVRDGGRILTRVEDRQSRSTRPHVRVSLSLLSHWFVENHWRIRFEPLPSGETFPSVDWALAHTMNAAGGGYAWPPLAFVPNGRAIEIVNAGDTPDEHSPVTFLETSGKSFVDPDLFQGAVDRLVEQTVERVRALPSSSLERRWNELLEERQDDAVAFYREIEARLGFQPGEAPEEFVLSWGRLVDEYGEQAIEEIAAAHQELEAARRVAESARTSPIRLEMSGLADLLPQARSEVAEAQGAAWHVARPLAARVRRTLGIEGPVEDRRIAELFGLDPKRGDRTAAFAAAWTHGDSLGLAYRSRSRTGRRFEIGRLVGDWLGFEAAPLRPSLNVATWRQQFQKAFSQAFLAPVELVASLGPASGQWDQDAIERVAKRLGVGEMTVTSTLKNNHLIPRDTDDAR